MNSEIQSPPSFLEYNVAIILDDFQNGFYFTHNIAVRIYGKFQYVCLFFNDNDFSFKNEKSLTHTFMSENGLKISVESNNLIRNQTSVSLLSHSPYPTDYNLKY